MQSKFEVFSGILLLLFSATVIAISMTFPGAVSGGRWIPGPGFFPILLAVVIAVCSVFLVKDGLSGWKKDEGNSISWGWGTLNVPIIIFSLVVYAVMMQWLGYILSTLIFSILLMVRMKAGWFRSSLVSACVVLFIFVIFSRVFKIQLPIGSLGLPW